MEKILYTFCHKTETIRDGISTSYKYRVIALSCRQTLQQQLRITNFSIYTFPNINQIHFAVIMGNLGYSITMLETIENVSHFIPLMLRTLIKSKYLLFADIHFLLGPLQQTGSINILCMIAIMERLCIDFHSIQH